jgi:phosphoglycerate dehydrogenase-like enzyme
MAVSASDCRIRMNTIFITSPLEAEQVARIRAVDPALRVLYEPDLLPPIRYIADHVGHPMERTPEQQLRWRELLGQANILWDIPAQDDLPYAKALRWIQTTSTGVGPTVAKRGLDKTDVLVTTARGVHAGPLAEFSLMALLSHFRGLRQMQEEQRTHQWIRNCGEEVAGRTMVIIGAGDLARGCAKLARAFDMRVVAVARDPAKSRSHNDLFDAVLPTAELHAALATADAVVITVPGLPATENMIDRAAIDAMRPGVALVNIGRGSVIDEAAMIHALRNGHIGFAALDVTLVEPLPADNPLWDMPNVLISPHSASTVSTENRKITDIFIYNLRCWLDGRPQDMKNVLDKNLLY